MMYPYPQTFNHQKPANSYTSPYHPCFESMAPKTNHPSLFGHLPCPNPSEHYYPPGYSYPHIQPPPQPYYHAPYPPYPDPYPAYFAPPQHYSLNHPRYEYDYDKAGHHCCSCLNHTCHRKEDTSPKIEENKPEKERDGDSIGLVGPQNYPYPYPVLWVPPNFDKENWNGWVPLDVNRLKGSKWEGEEKKQSPLPVVWMPGRDKPEEPTKEINPPTSFKIVPLKRLENVEEEKNPRVVDNEPKSWGQPEEPVEKERRTKTIPVVKLESRTSMPEKQEKEKADETKLITLEKQKEEGEVKKASEKKQASNVNSPKLPPVCLRVDPLPRRKKPNGTSRSPSPPGFKGEGSPRRSGQMPEKETRRETHIKDGPSSQEDNLAVASLEELSPIAVKDGAGKIEDDMKAKQTVVDVLDNATTEEKRDSMEVKCAEEERAIDVDDGDENMKGNKKKRILSQLDAALTIQSAFRGFEVRKWQPLEKLRKIARIREQMGSIRRQIESIEGFTGQKDARQRMIISETIMNLLLQLDTIQGLHPSVREARKSVARELTCLQEKLDSLGSLVNVEHEAVKVENNLSDQTSDRGEVCDDISSSEEEANLITEQESLDVIDSIDCTGAEELAKVEEKSKDETSDVEGACDVSPSVASKPISELKSMQPADANSAADESVTYKKTPPLVTEPTSEEKLDQVTGGEQIGEQLALEENVAESLEERNEGRACEVEVVETAVTESDEPVLSSIEASLDSELMSNDLCKQEVLHLPHVNASPDETTLIGSSKEVISQERKEEEEEMVDSEASNNTNHEPQKPSVQPLEVENNIVEAALVRDEELTFDGGKSTVTTPGEDSDHDKISSLELQKDALDLKEEMNNGVITEEKKLFEENEKLKDLLEKLLEEGKDKLGVINQLNGRVKELERKLTQKKRVKARRNRPAKIHSRGKLC